MGSGRDAGRATTLQRPRWKSLTFRRARRGKVLKLQLARQLAAGEISREQFDTAYHHVVIRACCSVRWGLSVWEEGVEYPPAAPHSPMQKCRTCRTHYPAAYIGSAGNCYDCHVCGMAVFEVEIDRDGVQTIVPGEAMRLPSSTSTVPISALPRPDQETIRQLASVRHRNGHRRWKRDRRVHTDEISVTAEHAEPCGQATGLDCEQESSQ